MPDYRLYLTDQGRFCTVATFVAETDSDADYIARVVFDACNDAIDGFELWESRRMVCTDMAEATLTPAPSVERALRRQTEVVATLKAIALSRHRIAASKRLLAALAALRQPPPENE